jgi:NTE family protein
MKRSAWVLMLLLCAVGVAPAQESVERQPARPRIGLVLGGGGAKGAAHVGLLKVLEELHVPVDCVVGTSMGALVGGAYATGMTSADVEKLLVSIDWSEAIGQAGVRDRMPIRQKASEQIYTNRLEVGVDEGRLTLPGGLVSSVEIERILRGIAQRVSVETSFAHFPLPYAAVATDIQTGEMVVLREGDLSVAMRASMAVPGVFAPVDTTEHLMVDGGMVRNLPVDVARELCADVVIASSLVTPTPKREDLNSAIAVASQSLDVLIKSNERASLATLGPADIAVMIDMEGIGSGDFDKVLEAMPRGEKAARAMADTLRRYSIGADQYTAWRNGIHTEPAAHGALEKVTLAGLERANPEVLELSLESRPGKPLSEADVQHDLRTLYARGDFQTVDYRVTGASSQPSLEYRLAEKSWGPDTLRFDLGLFSSLRGNSGFILHADHTRTWMNNLGGEWNSSVQFGRDSYIDTSFHQPLDVAQRFFVAPAARWSVSREDVFVNGDRVARYDFKDLYGALEFGMAFGSVAEWRVGILRGNSSAKIDTGIAALPEVDDDDVAGYTTRLVYDTRDAAFYPTRGSLFALTGYVSDPSIGASSSYERLSGKWEKAVAFREDTFVVQVRGGTDFDSGLPAYDLFTLGGQRTLSAFELEELRGSEYATLRVAYAFKVTDLQKIMRQALYAGITLEAGNMLKRIDSDNESGLILGTGLFIGGRTPLGPVLLSFGFAEGGQSAAFLTIGRPLDDVGDERW